MLTATNSILAGAIGTITRKKYNHISISLDKELTEVYSFGRLNPNNPIMGGFSQEDVTSDFFLKAECQVYELKVLNAEFKKIESVIETYKEYRNYYHYNFLGLITAWGNIPWDREFAYFCSEFVSTVLIEADLLDKYLEPSTTSPYDIIDRLDVDLIYEGDMWEYKLLGLPVGYIQRFKNFVNTRFI